LTRRRDCSSARLAQSPDALQLVVRVRRLWHLEGGFFDLNPRTRVCRRATSRLQVPQRSGGADRPGRPRVARAEHQLAQSPFHVKRRMRVRGRSCRGREFKADPCPRNSFLCQPTARGTPPYPGRRIARLRTRGRPGLTAHPASPQPTVPTPASRQSRTHGTSATRRSTNSRHLSHTAKCELTAPQLHAGPELVAPRPDAGRKLKAARPYAGRDLTSPPRLSLRRLGQEIPATPINDWHGLGAVVA
jgi:hypothetical protein